MIQMIKLILISTFLLTSSFGNALLGYETLDVKKEPDKFKKISYDKIPINFGEKVLISKNYFLVDSIICFLEEDSNKIKNSLKEIINNKIGIKSELNTIVKDYFEGLSDKEELRYKIKSLGLNLDRYEEKELISKRYNIIEKVEAFSELKIKVINGKDIFNKKCTIIVLTREDHWRDWAREWHTGIILPFKGMADTNIITEKEIALIEELKKELNIKKSSYHFPGLPWYPLELEILKELKVEAEKFNTQNR